MPRVLHRYPIFFAGPESLDWSGYESFCAEQQIPFRPKKFSGHFFEGIPGYNKLMMNVDFYGTFSEYEYMLIYQTDCFVFRDELAGWCRKGYDYIGAPWLNLHVFNWFLSPIYPKILVHIHRFFKERSVRKIGNGGLSLRKISSVIRNLKRFEKAAAGWQALEDSFFAHYVGTFNPFFRFPSVKTALRFSFDAYPEDAFKLNHHQLPFGCHGWYRNEIFYYENNLSFWEPIVKQYAGDAYQL